ncbi:MAG TPA: hypothetical protein VGH27_31605 [Streptosporangiaceae bacterium]|jgi:hypothetical protein
MLAAQLARLSRRSGIWLLAAVLVILNVLVARHNVEGLRGARADLASASAGRVVRNCVVYGGYTPVATCPEQTTAYLGPISIPTAELGQQLARFATCHTAQCVKASGPGNITVEVPWHCTPSFCSHSLGRVSNGQRGTIIAVYVSCAADTTHKCVPGFSLTQLNTKVSLQSQRQQIRQAVLVSSRTVDSAAVALAPRQRIRLALSLLASLPGLTLAVLLGAVAVGRGYRRKTWKARFALARSRPGRLAAKLAALWLVTLGLIVVGVLATLAAYAALAGGAHLAAWGRPAIPLPALLGTWVVLGLLASLSAAVSAAPKPASLMAAENISYPVPEPLAEHE